MAIPDLVLETDKRVSNVSADRIILRQSERGLVLKATILNPDGSKYDLSGKSVQFGETKDGEKAVVDSNVDVDTSEQGVIHYTLNKAVYAANGEAWFEIINGSGDVVDTTQNFVIEVEKEATINVSNDNYISSLEALDTHLKASIQKADNSLDNALTDMQGKCSNLLDQYQQTVDKIAQDDKDFEDSVQQKYQSIDQKLTDITNDWNTQKQNIQSTADQQIADIKSKADAQLADEADKSSKALNDVNQKLTDVTNDWNTQTKSIQDAADAQIADVKSKADAQRADEAEQATKALNNSIAQITAQRDQAIQQANDAYAKQRDDLTNQFNTWLQNTQQSYTDDITDLKGKLEAVRSDITKITGTDVPEMDQKIKDLEDKIAQAEKEFSSVNFSDYAKKEDVYDKPTVDNMVAQAGKVKNAKVSLDISDDYKFDSDLIAPDDNGTINLDLLQPTDTFVGYFENEILSRYLLKDDFTTQFDSNSQKLESEIEQKADKSDLDSKADKTDLDTKADKTDLDKKADVSTLNDYAKVSDLQTDTDQLAALESKVTELITKVNDLATKLGSGTVALLSNFDTNSLNNAIDYSKDQDDGITRIGIVDDGNNQQQNNNNQQQ